MLGVYWFLYANVCGKVVTCVVVCEFVFSVRRLLCRESVVVGR